MEIVEVKEERFEEALALSEYAFQYKVPENERQDRINMYRSHTVFGIFNDGKLSAKLHIIPFETYLGAKKVKLGGIASVATYPEFRRKGYVKALIHHALKYMKDNQFSLSMLHPFEVSFYRKFGWELFSNLLKSELEKKDLVPMESVKGTIRRFTKDSHPSIIEQLYETYAEQFSGMLVRNKEWWLQQVYSNHAAVYYDAQDQACGYIMYDVEKSKMHVEEFVALSEEGRRGLWNFICQHDSMVNEVHMTTFDQEELFFSLEEPRIKQERKPYFMARVVDVGAILHEYPFDWSNQERSIILHVVDEQAPWNNDSFQLDGEKIKRVDRMKEGIHLSVQSLATILLGYKRPQTMQRMGRVKGDITQIKELEKLVPNRPSFFYDFF